MPPLQATLDTPRREGERDASCAWKESRAADSAVISFSWPARRYADAPLVEAAARQRRCREGRREERGIAAAARQRALAR